MAKRKADGSLCEEKVVNVTTGQAFEEEYSFNWKIENFSIIKSSGVLVNEQQFNFMAGKSVGYPTKWRCYLEKVTGGISTNLMLLSTGPVECKISGNYSFQTIKGNGSVGATLSAEGKMFYRGYSISGCTIPVGDEALKELIWEDGSIAIKVNLKLFIFKPENVKLEEEVICFEKREVQKLWNSMTRMIEPGSQAQAGKIIKVVSKDGAEFCANSFYLAERSPVFKAMFDSGKWKESQDSIGGDGGPLVLEDLSGKTVKVLLHYLVGGALLQDDWKAEDVILELTYAADKYQLEGLIEFLDRVLPKITFNGTEILAKLALLTNKLGMKNAEKGLFSKLKETATDINQLILDKEGSLLGKD